MNTKDAKLWESVTQAVEWVGFRADKAVMPVTGKFCFAAKISCDNAKTKFSVYQVGKRAAIYIEHLSDDNQKLAYFLSEEDIALWDMPDY